MIEDFKPGDIVRYGIGTTALARLQSPHVGGWHAGQCMGGTTWVHKRNFQPFRLADEEDMRIWKRCGHWRGEVPHPQHLPHIYKKDGLYRCQAQREISVKSKFYSTVRGYIADAEAYCQRMNTAAAET